MKKHGCLWWLFIGWWWLPIKWFYYSIPVFIIRKIAKCVSSKAVHSAKETTPTPPKAPQTIKPQNIKTYRATGMSYRLDALLSIGSENEDYSKTKKELAEEGLTDQRIYQYDFYPRKIELVPEPDNPHDPNAIKVMADDVHIAYIKAGSCAHLLKAIKSGQVKKIDCEITGGKYKYLSCDCDEDGRETYSMEKGEAPYSVVLHVTEE